VNEADANLFDWAHDTNPKASLQVPPGYLGVRVQNAQRTSAGPCVPGQVVALPDAEARALLREGTAREVRVIPATGQ
jgi:hypothetical protein